MVFSRSADTIWVAYLCILVCMDYKTLRRWLKDNGYQLATSGKSHYFVYSGEKRVGMLPCSPSDYRGVLNTIAQLRQSGVPVPRKGQPR